MYDYELFGLLVSSAFHLSMLQKTKHQSAQVSIVAGELDANSAIQVMPDVVSFSIPDLARFRISGGDTITVQLEEGASMHLLSLYLLGSCMGAILWQRGGMLLHGSCVAKDGKGLLLTGASGAGKSTLAREFLRNGWQLVTDDVASIVVKDGVHYVQSSYPSQKLWQDAMERYTLEGESLYQENRKDKYHVDASAYFKEGLTPLCGVVRLAVGEETAVHPVEGIAQVDQLMKNTYRPYMIPAEHRERHFQRCVALADEVPMLLGIRTDAPDGAALLREKIEEAFL